MQTVVPFTEIGAPLSRPGCWAWPGELQVGAIMQPTNRTKLDLAWNRAHFSAWCIISSPLIIGQALDFTSSMHPVSPETLEAVVPILTNPRAIAINQAWAGSPGRLLISLDPTNPNKPDENGFLKLIGKLQQGCLFYFILKPRKKNSSSSNIANKADACNFDDVTFSIMYIVTQVRLHPVTSLGVKTPPWQRQRHRAKQKRHVKVSRSKTSKNHTKCYLLMEWVARRTTSLVMLSTETPYVQLINRIYI